MIGMLCKQLTKNGRIFMENFQNMLEDDNRHSVTSLGKLIIDMMEKCGISEKEQTDMMCCIMEKYALTNSLS